MRKNRYGSFDDLSLQNRQDIENVIDKIEKANIEFDIYYGYPVIDENNKKDYVKGLIITQKGIISLYEYSEEEVSYRARIFQLISQDSALVSLLYSNKDLLKFIELNKIENIVSAVSSGEDLLTDENIIKVNRAIQMAYGLSNVDNREILKEDSLGEKIKKRNSYIGKYDATQFNMIHSYENKNLRIRGLAGSGKTILMVKKMAYLHYKDKNKKIAFVFYTQSLKQTILKMFKKFYKDYDRYGEPNFSNVSVLHSWGGKYTSGFYSELSNICNEPVINLFEAKTSKAIGEDAFEYVCRRLISNLSVEKLEVYDYVFIDEAQDFKIQFFNLVKKSLKNEGKIIYAYDELQSLNEDNSIPSKSEIFGEEECIDINLKISYRTPVQVLSTAHALGLGIYREVEEGELPFVNMIKDKEVWKDIGYEVVDGELSYGKYVELKRTEDMIDDQNILNVLPNSSEEMQYQQLSQLIMKLIDEEDILAEDILVIDLDSKNLKVNHQFFRNTFNNLARENGFLEEDKIKISINLINKDNPNVYRNKGQVAYTTIFRAKGNEANIVFVINAGALQMLKSHSRNQIFTAMTRTKYAVWLMGEKIEGYINEIRKIEEKHYKLAFTYPTEPELEKIKTYGEIDSKSELNYYGVEKNFEELLGNNPELAKYLLNKLNDKLVGTED